MEAQKLHLSSPLPCPSPPRKGCCPSSAWPWKLWASQAAATFTLSCSPSHSPASRQPAQPGIATLSTCQASGSRKPRSQAVGAQSQHSLSRPFPPTLPTSPRHVPGSTWRSHLSTPRLPGSAASLERQIQEASESRRHSGECGPSWQQLTCGERAAGTLFEDGLERHRLGITCCL